MDNPVMAFLGKVADLLIVNLLWIVCSVPIVTIGASTTAMYYVSFKIVNGEEPSIFKSFFGSWKENFRQATIIWMFLLLVGCFLIFDIYSVTSLSLYGSNVGTILLGIFILVAVIVLPMLLYSFAIQAHFENTVKNTLKNAAILGISRFGYTLGMVVGDAVLSFLCVRYCPLAMPAFPIWFNTMVMRRIFADFIPHEDETAD